MLLIYYSLLSTPEGAGFPVAIPVKDPHRQQIQGRAVSRGRRRNLERCDGVRSRVKPQPGWTQLRRAAIRNGDGVRFVFSACNPSPSIGSVERTGHLPRGWN